MKTMLITLLLAVMAFPMSNPFQRPGRDRAVRDSIFHKRAIENQTRTRQMEQNALNERMALERKMQQEREDILAGKLAKPRLMKAAAGGTQFTLSGTVTTEDGGYVPSLYFTVYTTKGEWFDSEIFYPSGNVKSYRYSFLLDSGDYFIRIQDLNDKYCRMFYKSSFDFGNGEAVHLNQNRDTIGFVLLLGGTIKGEVKDAQGYALKNVRVLVERKVNDRNIDGSPYKYGQTDSLGKYIIAGLRGTYRVRTECDFALNEYYNDKKDYKSADSITVSGGQTISNIDFILNSGATITGRITAPSGSLLPQNFTVWVIPDSNLSDWPHTKEFWLYTWNNKTPAETTFVIRGIPIGSYKIKFDIWDNSSNLKNQYYNNVTDFNNADTIVLTEGQFRDSINFNLETGIVIKGHIRAVDGGTLPNSMQIYVWSDTTTDMYHYTKNTSLYFSNPTKDITYTVGGLEPGRYTVGIGVDDTSSNYYGQYYGNKMTFEEALYFNRSKNDTASDIDFSLTKGGSISGTIRTSDNHPLPSDLSININTSDYSSEIIYRLYKFISQEEPISASIPYTIKGLPPATYSIGLSISFSFDPSPYINYYYYNQVFNEEKATPVVINGAEQVNGIDFTMIVGGEIRGIISTADGKPLPRSYSVATYDTAGNLLASYSYPPLPFSYNDLSVPRIVTTRPYVIRGINPGKFIVHVEAEDFLYWPEHWDSSSYKSKFFPNGQGFDEAARLNIASGEVIDGINFSLEEGGVISGRATDSITGKPLLSQYFLALPECKGSFWEFYQKGLLFWTYTDSNGYYHLSGLPDGKYRIQHFPLMDNTVPGYRAEFYPNASIPSAATKLSIIGANQIEAIDFNLKSGGWGAISGYFISTKGDTLRTLHDNGKIDLPMAFKDSVAMSLSSVFRSDPKTLGRFIMPGLPAGEYKVGALLSYQNITSSQPLSYKFHFSGRDFASALPVTVTIGDTTEHADIQLDSSDIAVEQTTTDPDIVTALEGNVPNPFNPVTTIRFSVAAKDVSTAKSATIHIYDIRGKLVKSMSQSVSKAGRYSMVWDGKDGLGNGCSAGIYVYRLTIGSRILSRSMVMLK